MPGFPERLKLLRQNFGLSQQKLADEIGIISKSSINMYERGDREPSMETMEALADFFNVDLAYLFGRSDIPNSSAMCPSEVSHSQLRLTSHEHAVILAYRQHPDAQPFVDKLLGLDVESVPQPKQA